MGVWEAAKPAGRKLVRMTAGCKNYWCRFHVDGTAFVSSAKTAWRCAWSVWGGANVDGRKQLVHEASRAEILPQMLRARCRAIGGRQETESGRKRPTFPRHQVSRSPSHLSPSSQGGTQVRCRTWWPVWTWQHTAQTGRFVSGKRRQLSIGTPNKQSTHRLPVSQAVLQCVSRVFAIFHTLLMAFFLLLG